MLRRSPLRRGTPLRRGKRLNPVSARRSESWDDWEALKRAVHERDGWRCVARYLVPEVRCAGPLDADHIKPAGVGGLDTLDNLQALCRAHHDYKHANPVEAAQLGLRRWSWQ